MPGACHVTTPGLRPRGPRPRLEEPIMPSAAFEASLPFVLRCRGSADHPMTPADVPTRASPEGSTMPGVGGRACRCATSSVSKTPSCTASTRPATGLPPRCDRLARRLDLVHFDTAVNMGPGRAVRFLQKAAGCGVDGDFGSQTEKAIPAVSRAIDCRLLCHPRGLLPRARAPQRQPGGVPEGLAEPPRRPAP